MNIEEYEFIDVMVDYAQHSSKKAVNIKLRRQASSVIIYEKDAIALAKHFKLDLDLLNQLKDKFINSNQSCELILADMINSMELEKANAHQA